MVDRESISTDDITDKAADFLAVIGVMSGVLIFFGFTIYQIYLWMRTGSYIPIPIVAIPDYFGWNLNLIYEPTDWRGLANVAKWYLEQSIAVGGSLTIVLLTQLIRIQARY